jgi:anti-sigma regulatory factor (Ser/Thr protein kinase)
MRGELLHERVLEWTFPSCSASARLARATAHRACRAWRISAVRDVAVLAVSELVGNAARHAVGGR